MLAVFQIFFSCPLIKVSYGYHTEYHEIDQGFDEYITNGSFNSVIQPFRTPFWLNEKRWFVTFDNLLRDSDLRIYTTPAIIEESWNSTRCELSVMGSVPCITKRSINKTVNATIDEVFIEASFLIRIEMTYFCTKVLYQIYQLMITVNSFNCENFLYIN
jgi:hypothetical protein